jgi:hypothetical protein
MDKVKARASLFLPPLLIATFAFAVRVRISSWTPERSLGYGV